MHTHELINNIDYLLSSPQHKVEKDFTLAFSGQLTLWAPRSLHTTIPEFLSDPLPGTTRMTDYISWHIKHKKLILCQAHPDNFPPMR